MTLFSIEGATELLAPVLRHAWIVEARIVVKKGFDDDENVCFDGANFFRCRFAVERGVTGDVFKFCNFSSCSQESGGTPVAQLAVDCHFDDWRDAPEGE